MLNKTSEKFVTRHWFLHIIFVNFQAHIFSSVLFYFSAIFFKNTYSESGVKLASS